MASLGEDLLSTVNKLQDLVFNTIGNDSLDLPQIVSCLFMAVYLKYECHQMHLTFNSGRSSLDPSPLESRLSWRI